MMDLALRWSVDLAAADLAVESNDLATDAGLETAVLLSLFTDRRAEDGDVLHDGETDRRGWWADALPDAGGDRMGSRLWLLAREKPTASVLDRAREYTGEALKWLVDDRVAARVEVSAEYPSRGVLAIGVEVFRPGKPDPVRFRFDGVWRAMA